MIIYDIKWIAGEYHKCAISPLLAKTVATIQNNTTNLTIPSQISSKSMIDLSNCVSNLFKI
jgi:hypothetical protein